VDDRGRTGEQGDGVPHGLGPQPALAQARGLLAQIDALEAAVRQAEPPALARAASLALAVEDILRAFARKLEEKAP
jgi:hypothetical protein